MKYLYEFHWKHDGDATARAFRLSEFIGISMASLQYPDITVSTEQPFHIFVFHLLLRYLHFFPSFFAPFRTERFDKTHESTWRIDTWYFVKRGLFFNDYSIFFSTVASWYFYFLYLFFSVTIIFVSQTEVRKRKKIINGRFIRRIDRVLIGDSFLLFFLTDRESSNWSMNEKYSLKNKHRTETFYENKILSKKKIKGREKVNRFHGSIKGGIRGNIHQKLLEGMKNKMETKIQIQCSKNSCLMKQSSKGNINFSNQLTGLF